MSKVKKVGEMVKGKGPSRWNTVALFFVLIFLSLYISTSVNKPSQKDLPYTEFKNLIRDEAVTKIVVRGQTVTGYLAAEKTYDGKSYKSFKTIIPTIDDPGLMTLIEGKNVTLIGGQEKDSWLGTLAISLLPWILIFGFFYYSSQQMKKRLGGGLGDKDSPFSFYRSKARLFDKKENHSINFDNVAGCENAKKEMQEVVEFLKKPEIFTKMGAELPKGVLLVGPPGTGKTLMARAVAGEADVPFFSLSASEFIEMFVGVGASRVRDLFNEAKKNAPSIIFIDEIDSIGRSRGTGLGGGHDEREQTLNQILSEMDGFEKHTPVIVIAATNRPDVLDSALVRPGRFDRHVTMDLPHKEARVKILELHCKKIPLAQDAKITDVAMATVGFSGAMLKNLVNEAAINAARNERDQVGKIDFEQARDKIILGIERNTKLDDKQKRVVAYHEAGHAVAAYFLDHTDPLNKVSIIPRGRALGFTEQTPEEDVYNINKSYLLDKIATLLAGRSAEEIIFKEITTGAENDLKEASKLARKMVSNWGMSDEMGEVFYNTSEEHPFLGREITRARDFSDSTANEIDCAVRTLITQQKKRVIELLMSKKEALDGLAQALIENETIGSDEIKSLIG